MTPDIDDLAQLYCEALEEQIDAAHMAEVAERRYRNVCAALAVQSFVIVILLVAVTFLSSK